MTRRPLRICMLTTFYPPYHFGGDGIFVYRLSNELGRLGHSVEVIHSAAAYHLLARKKPGHRVSNHSNVTVHPLDRPSDYFAAIAAQQTGTPLFASRYIRRVLDRGFDVIHYHNISLVGGPKVLQYGQGIKLYTMHEYWLVCPTHVLFKFNRRVCARKSCFLCSLAYLRPPQWWRYTNLLKRSAKHVDAFIAPNRFCSRLHHHKGFPYPMVHLPNFLTGDTPAQPIQNPSHGEGGQSPYFLFVGRLEKLKGLQTLLPVFDHYPKARLLIAGKGYYASALKHLSRKTGNIVFLGHLNHGRLRALYQGALALIVPSACFEIFPLVVLEALREKTPIIARHGGGIEELIQNSEGGIVYKNIKELIAAMDSLVDNPSYRRRLGDVGNRYYRRHWSLDRHLEGYLGLIDQLDAD